jgi:hypothetical protein
MKVAHSPPTAGSPAERLESMPRATDQAQTPRSDDVNVFRVFRENELCMITV